MRVNKTISLDISTIKRFDELDNVNFSRLVEKLLNLWLDEQKVKKRGVDHD